MKYIYILWIILFIELLNVNQDARACSDIIINTGSEKVSARNMDWPSDGNAMVVINPRGIYRESTEYQPGDTRLNWVSKYGSVGVKFLNIGFVDSINEHGLSAGLLWLGETEYPAQSASPVLSLDLWAQYYLDNCQTVAEAVALAPTFRVYTGISFFGLHLILHDASGDSVLMEYTGGVLNIYHPMEQPVVTNDPPYPEQLANLLNYENFGGDLPVPGGNDPESRFVRAAWNLQSLPVPTSADEALGSAFDIIQNVAQPPSLGPTWWTAVRDHTARKFYWRTIYNANIRYVDLNNLDFSPGNPVKVLGIYTDLVGDTSSYFKPEVKHFSIDSGDYNGDGTSDIAIFRSRSGLWSVRGITRAYFGGSADLPVPGDYNGDGITDMALYRGIAGLWAIRNLTRTYFGSSASQPVPGDYEGNGTCDIGIFRETDGLWAIKGVTRAYFGRAGDLPVPGDYDGDGSIDPGVFRESDRLWAFRNISRIYFAEDYIPIAIIPGDYDGDGTWEPAYFEESNIIDPAGSPAFWKIRGVTKIYFGNGSDQPVPANYAGDSLNNLGIFRPDSGLWVLRGITRAYYGTSWDVPVTR